MNLRAKPCISEEKHGNLSNLSSMYGVVIAKMMTSYGLVTRVAGKSSFLPVQITGKILE